MTQVQLAPPGILDPARSLTRAVIGRAAAVPRLETCIQCATLGGSCALAADRGHTPVGIAG